MPNSPFPFRRRTPRQQAFALAVGAIAIVCLAAVLYPHDHGAGVGALCGGGVVLLFGAVALVRARRGEARTSFERGMGGAADERDKAIMVSTFAVAGWAGIVCMAIDLVALVLGAPALPAAAVMMWATLLSLVVANVVLSRRM